MAGPAVEVRQILDLHRAQLAGVIELRGVNRLRKIYEQARAEIRQRLSDLLAEDGADLFTAQHYRLLLGQIESGLAMFSARFRKHLTDTGELASTLGSRHVIAETKKFERVFTGLTPVIEAERIGVLRSIDKSVLPSLLTRYQQSMEFYGRPTVEAVHKQLAMSLATNDTVSQAVERVSATDGVFNAQRWRAERIVRTELSYSYGVTKQRAMEEIRVQHPTLKKKLIATFDNRTGEDSKELHGQTVPIDQPFMWRTRLHGAERVIPYMQPP